MLTPSHPLTRREFVRLAAGGSLALVAGGLLTAKPAAAGRTWCKLDPVVKIDGAVADIYLSSYQELHQTATGPAEIVVSLPRGSTGELLAVDRGFGGHGYVVTFATDDTLNGGKGKAQVKVEAFVPSADDGLPLQVDFAPRSSDLAPASAKGSVNQYWVTLKTR